MNRQFAIWTLILTSLTSFSQNLTVDAIYYNKDGNPYKIERKHTDDQSVLYVRHNNSNSVCVKRQTTIRQDTTIVQETYYNIFREKTKLEKFSDCDSWMVSSTNNGDTVTLTGYAWDEFVGDTVLTGKDAKESWNFADRIKSARVPMILDDKIHVSLDSLVPNESFKAYYVDGLPVKIEQFNSKQDKHTLTACELSDNMMICKSYFYKETIELFQTDTISWNKDTTEIEWIKNRFEFNKVQTTKYKLNNNTLTITTENNRKEIEFLYGSDIFQNLLTSNLVYNDVLYYMELRLFDRQKTVKVVSQNGQSTNNKFTFDEQKRITSQVIYQDQELQKRIVYNYQKE